MFGITLTKLYSLYFAILGVSFHPKFIKCCLKISKILNFHLASFNLVLYWICLLFRVSISVFGFEIMLWIWVFSFSKLISLSGWALNWWGSGKTFTIVLYYSLYYSLWREIAIDKHSYCKHNWLQGSYTDWWRKNIKKMLQS